MRVCHFLISVENWTVFRQLEIGGIIIIKTKVWNEFKDVSHALDITNYNWSNFLLHASEAFNLSLSQLLEFFKLPNGIKNDQKGNGKKFENEIQEMFFIKILDMFFWLSVLLMDINFNNNASFSFHSNFIRCLRSYNLISVMLRKFKGIFKLK